MLTVASAQILLAEDVGSWSVAHWIGVIVSVIVGTVLLILLVIAALAGGEDGCAVVLAAIVAASFVAYIVWSWWLGPFIGHL